MRPSRRGAITVALAAVLSIPAAGAAGATLPAGSTTLISGPSLGVPLPTGDVNTSSITRRAMSLDGRYVVFASESDAFLPDGMHSDDTQLFWLDRLNGILRLVSAAPDGTPGDAYSSSATISSDGTKVAFTSSAKNLATENTSGQFGVFVRTVNPALGTTALISRVQDDATGGQPGSSADAPAGDTATGGEISANGLQVAFTTSANNMAPGLSGTFDRVYRRNTTGNGSTVLVSKNDAGTSIAADSYVGSLSSTGQFVAFYTAADNVDADAPESNTKFDIYLRDVTNSQSIWASPRTNETATTTGNSYNPDISANGANVVFESTASDLSSSTDANATTDVYVRNRTSGNTILVSQNPSGAAGNEESNAAAISSSGNKITWSTEASDLVGAVTDNNGSRDVVVRDYDQIVPITRLLGHTPSGGAPASPSVGYPISAVSYDGTAAAFDSYATDISDIDDDDFGDVFATSTASGTGPVEHLSRRPGSAARESGGLNDSSSGSNGVSRDGRFVVFVSRSDGFSTEDDDVYQHAFVRDSYLGTTMLVDRASGTGPSGNGDASGVAINADGTKIAFSSAATNLDPADGDANNDVYVRDLITGTTTLASRASGADGANADASASAGSLSAGGQRIAFSTKATNLGAGGDADTDVFVRDLAAATTTLASVANGPDGVSADGNASSGQLDAGGTKVLFTTTAANLGDGDGDATSDVHLRDLLTGTTTLVSRADGPDGAKFTSATNGNALNADGTVALLQVNGGADQGVWVRNLAAGTTVLAARADGPDGAPPASLSSATDISDDGSRVLFGSFSGNLTGEAALSTPEVYVRDLPAGRTLLISRDDGAAGAPLAPANVLVASGLSGNGRCATFTTRQRLGASPYPSADFQQTYLRAIDAECALAPVAPAPTATPTPTPTPTPTVTPDRTKPVLSGFSTTRKRFAVSGKATALTAAKRKAAPKGTTLKFRLSETATVRIVISRELSGRRRGRSCVKPTAKLRKAKRCTRLQRRGTLTRRSLKAGARSVAFSGRLGRKALPRGKFRAVATPTDAAGNVGTARTVRFTIVRP